MYFHGSPLGGLEWLKPGCALSENPCVFLSSNRAHATLYTVRKNFYPYGFDKATGLVCYTEPYKNCLKDIYGGKSGYVYEVGPVEGAKPLEGIRYAHVATEDIKIASFEFIEDVYARLIEYSEQGQMMIEMFHETAQARLAFYEQKMVEIIINENLLQREDDYAVFVKSRFPDALRRAVEIDEANRKGPDGTLPRPRNHTRP